jgi:hypothetical protein
MAVKEEVLAAQEPPPMITQGFYYSPFCFLRTVLAIAWSAFAHPFSSTVIDLATGQMQHEGREERE